MKVPTAGGEGEEVADGEVSMTMVEIRRRGRGLYKEEVVKTREDYKHRSIYPELAESARVVRQRRR